jgi:serine/threonine protein kinase/WD40 repeat protein
MADSDSDREPLEELAESFLARYRAGERPALSEFTAAYPELAKQIRELFPALIDIERAGSAIAPATGTIFPVSGGDGAALTTLGDYRIIREVGRGGMGVVYEAVQESLGRHVALKVFVHSSRTDPKLIERFQREARAAARLHHTNIVPVFGVGEYGAHRYYAMQFIQGQGLDAILHELRRLRSAPRANGAAPVPAQPAQSAPLAATVAQGLLTGRFAIRAIDAGGDGTTPDAQTNGFELGDAPRQSEPAPAAPSNDASHWAGQPGGSYARTIARVGFQVADALAHAHGQGILHRDIKPANLLLDIDGNVWVTDFGLAKADDAEALTEPGDIVGTLRYMAPERFRGDSVPGSDVYGLGMTLYELLTLRPAFDEGDRARLIDHILHADPPPPRAVEPKVPRDLETIVLKAIAKHPGDRYQSPRALADDLGRFLQDRTILARRSSVSERLWRWCKRNPGLAALAALAATLTTAIAIISTVAALWLGQSRNLAKKNEQKAKEQTEIAERNLDAAEMRGRIARSHRLAAMADAELGRRYDLSLLLSLASLQLNDRSDDDSEGRRSLFMALNARPKLVTILHNDLGGSVTSVAFHPDGKVLAAGFAGGAASGVILFDIGSRRQLGDPIEVPRCRVRGVTFSRDGRILAAGYEDDRGGGVILFDIASRRQMGAPLEPPRGRTLGVAFSPDGKVLAAGCGVGLRDYGVIFFDLASRRPLGNPIAVPEGVVYGVAFSPDGKVLAADYTNGIRVGVILFDVASRRRLGGPIPVPGRYVRGVSFSPDGKDLAVGTRSGVVLFDIAKRHWQENSLGVTEGSVQGVTCGPDGKVLAAGFAGAGGGGVILFNTFQPNRLVERLPVPGGRVHGVAFSPDGKVAAAAYFGGDAGGGVNLFEAASRRLLGSPLKVSHRFVRGVAFSPDGKVLAAAHDDARSGGVTLFDLASRRPIGDPLPVPWAYVGRVAFSPDGKTLAASAHGGVILFDVASHHRRGDPMDVPQGGSWGLAFSPDGSTLASSARGGVILFDLASHRRLDVALVVPEGPVHGVVFSPDGRVLAAGYGDSDSDGGVILFDLAGHDRLGEPLALPQGVWTVAFSPDGSTLAAGYGIVGLGGVALFDVASRRPLGDPLLPPEGRVRGVAFSPDGKVLVAGSETTYSGWVILCDVDLESWQHRACRIANRNLSWDEWTRLIDPGISYGRMCPELPNGKGMDAAPGEGNTGR